MSAPRRPRVLPDGCEKAAEVFHDTVLGLYYLKWRGRRSASWQICEQMPPAPPGAGPLRWLADGSRTLLKTREAAARLIGGSVEAHVLALHPLAGYAHLTQGRGTAHLCEAPYIFKTAYALEDVTCPVCRALALNRLTAGAFGVHHGEEKA